MTTPAPPPFILGRCHLCGQNNRVLTYEHVPAQSAFNSQPIETFGLEHWLARDADGQMSGGEVQERGAGAHTLCSDCNSTTGSWYVPELKAWTRLGLSVLQQIRDGRLAGGNGVEVGYPRVYPLRFLKQVIAMLASVNEPEFLDQHPALRAFVLDPQAKGLPARYQVYLALTDPATTFARHAGLTARAAPGTWSATWLTEIVWPPCAYILTIDEPVPYLAAGNITAFADYGFDERVDLLRIVLPILIAEQPFPGEYTDPANRSSEERPFPTATSAFVRMKLRLATGELREGDITLPVPIAKWRGDELWELVKGMLRLLGVQEGETYKLIATWNRDRLKLEIRSARGTLLLEPPGVPLVAIEEFTGHAPAPLEGVCRHEGPLKGPPSQS